MKTKSVIILSLFLMGFACDQNTSRPDHRIQVAASILPLQDFVNQIGGQEVTSFVVIPPGASPHTFELVPTMLRKINNSQILVLNGLGLEPWSARVIDTVGEEKLKVIVTSREINALATETSHHHQHGEHSHDHPESGNPHVWLDPVLAIKQVEQIAAGFASAFPVHADSFLARRDRYKARLLQLDQEIQAKVRSWSHRDFVCFHPAWEYFAHRYGLNQAAVITDRPGMEPSPSRMAHVIETLNRTGAKAVFSEPQFSESLLRAIAEEANVSVVQLDPLGTTLENGGYIELMQYNVAKIESALK
jgi:ABC-type Zn uptake system ZnuABC Zn-binding protein ZnuA